MRISWKTKFLVRGILIQGISQRYLVRGIDPRYLVQGIGPKWFWSKVLKKGLKLYKEENIIRPRVKEYGFLRNTSV